MRMNSVVKYSTLAVLVALTPMAGIAAVHITPSRANRADAYQQLNAQVAAANMPAPQPTPTIQDAVNALPIRVANENLAKKIATGDETVIGTDRLAQCAESNPGFEMVWAQPTLGSMAGGASTCVALVELQGYQMGPNATNAVFARGYLAAGDVVKCNISDFPASSYLDAAGTVTFPADTEPTIEDVTRVMDEEQKQNAGFKIAASVIIGGLGGNIAGKSEPGQTGLLGGGKDKITSTVIGALGGGALATAGSFSGKVAGDTIMGVGVNAAAGGVIGNMAASGESVLRIETCKMEDGTEVSCLWGVLRESKSLDAEEVSCKDNNGEIQKCKKVGFFNVGDMKSTIVCTQQPDNIFGDCRPQELVGVYIYAKDPENPQTEKATELSSLVSKKFENLPDNVDYYSFDTTDKVMAKNSFGEGKYVRIHSAGIPTSATPAALINVHDSLFGLKEKDWREKIKDNLVTVNDLYGRNATSLYKLTTEYENLDTFYPMYIDADDGGIVDISNKARLKSTGIGAAAGGALGGYAAYEGAQSDINDRWTAAVREYKDSLTKFYCWSGSKFMSSYNDRAVVNAPSAE